jgi:hypothetical protein
MIFDWIGESFLFGQKASFFQITYENVSLVYSIYKTTKLSDYPFKIERVSKNIKNVNVQHEIEEKISDVYLIHTDDHFRKKFKRSYSILKFVVGSDVVTIGGYTDNEKRMSSDNVYVICGKDFINILAKAEKIENASQLDNTPFEDIKPIFDKKELAKELLRE